ncbi:hypothetical protein N752_14715 [Desulforamulus aquiferis]|nr:hypothetical protein N752_14715 [Desulforamulus aquiferis]
MVLAAKGKIWRNELEKKENRLFEAPFDSDRKRMSVVYQDASGSLTGYVKGAPDVMLELCTHIYRDGRVVP